MPVPRPLEAPLRLTTWLAPSLPMALFEALAARISLWTGRPVELASDPERSGPQPWIHDPFAAGEVDVGFLCSPSWSWLADQPVPSVVPVPALPVPIDPRAGGRPVYFSDVIAPVGGASSLEELRGGRWAFNDSCSLSGWFSLTSRIGDARDYFREVIHSGSHLASIRMVAAGEADGAAIDSTVLGWVLAADPSLSANIRVITSWGPHPIQPVVARATLDARTTLAVAAALRSFDPAAGAGSALARFGIAGFVAGRPGALPHDLRRALPA